MAGAWTGNFENGWRNMAEYASSDIRVGTLRVRGTSESAAREGAAAFSQALTSELSSWSPGRASDCNVVKLAVERGSGETVAEAATRALKSHFGEVRRG